MLENTFAFFGVIIFLLMAYGTFAKVKLFAILGSIFLLIFGLLICTDGVQLKTGEQVLTSGTTTLTGNVTAYALNETTSFIYTDPPKFSVFEWSFMLGLIFILGGIAGMYIFAFE